MRTSHRAKLLFVAILATTACMLSTTAWRIAAAALTILANDASAHRWSISHSTSRISIPTPSTATRFRARARR